eukprot:9022241-Prorocentrum_lima.AAC.1
MGRSLSSLPAPSFTSTRPKRRPLVGALALGRTFPPISTGVEFSNVKNGTGPSRRSTSWMMDRSREKCSKMSSKE